MIQAARRTAPEGAGDAARVDHITAPLPYEQVDEILKRFYKRHHASSWTAGPMTDKRVAENYSPSRMPAHSFQNAANASGLQHQAELHLNVAALLSAFAFAAAGAEAVLSPSAVQESGNGNATSVSTASVMDQAIFLNLSLATALLLGTVLHFMYIDMGLGTKGGMRYWHAYSAKLGTSCVSFHLGCSMLVATFPLWAYRKFDFAPAFYGTLALAVLWVVYDFCLLLPSHNELNQLLAHAEMGINAEKRLAVWDVRRNWTAEAWHGQYQQHLARGERGTDPPDDAQARGRALLPSAAATSAVMA